MYQCLWMCIYSQTCEAALSLFLFLLHHPLILTVCLCMTACCLSFFIFPWPVFSSLFSSSPSFSFSPPLSSKTVKVRIIDDEEYEKNKSFFLEIGEPQLVETNEKRGGGEWPELAEEITHTTHTHTLNTCPLWTLSALDHHRDQLQAKLQHRQPSSQALACACLCVCVCVFHACIIPTPSCCLVSAGRRYQSGFSIERNTISNAAFT